jgi:hypothetical protein
MPSIRVLAAVAVLSSGLLAAVPGVAQQSMQSPVVLGPAGRSTVLSPDLRSTEVALDAAGYGVLIPGCTPQEPGVFHCESLHQYQHCRTLMFSNMVHSCRADLAFQSAFAEPYPAGRDQYDLSVESDARVRVERGDRGLGIIRGSVDVELSFRPPLDSPGSNCLLRDRFVYQPTGPEGGMSTIDAAADCDEPIRFSFAPHDDDILRASDICETFAAWGDEIEDTIDVLAAGLFHIHSDDPEFRARHPGGTGIIAPYVTVTAPLKIECRE